jgi:putative transposase
MAQSRFTETRIHSILKEAVAGLKVSDICRKHGISDATCYSRKAKYGRMSASDLKGMKEMEAELSRLKRMDGDLARENQATEGQWGQPCSKGNAHRSWKLRCTFPAPRTPRKMSCLAPH